MGKKKIEIVKTDFLREIKKYFFCSFLNGRMTQSIIRGSPKANPKKWKTLYVNSRGHIDTFGFKKNSIKGKEILYKYKKYVIDGAKLKRNPIYFDLFKKYWKPGQNTILIRITPNSDKSFPNFRYYYDFFGILAQFNLLKKKHKETDFTFGMTQHIFKLNFKDIKDSQRFKEYPPFIGIMKYTRDKICYLLLERVRSDTGNYYIDDNNYMTICNNIGEVVDFIDTEKHTMSAGFFLSKVKNYSQVINLLNETLQLFKSLEDNALVYFLKECTAELIRDLRSEKKILKCGKCGRIMKFKAGKRYCSLLSEGRDCGKKARFKRYYLKHAKSVRIRSRNYMRVLRREDMYIDKRRNFKRTEIVPTEIQ